MSVTVTGGASKGTAQTALVTVTGDFDLYVREQAQAAILRVDGLSLDEVIVDLSELGYMDSTGVSMLLTIAHRLRRRGGRIRLRGASPEAIFLLDVRGGMDLFDSENSGFSYGKGRSVTA